ncbi:MAG: hypothetical protein EBR82_42650 [Caulobacteraceae bacterium]|nr:hypothetical protein [Caulobacteraceae bacterium]
MAMPTLGVSVDFANGPAFGNPLILGDASTPLGVGILADAASDVVDVSDITLRASIRRGRNRILNKFEAGTATVVLEDTNGDWVPSNTASPYYGKLVPLRKIRIYADYNSVRYYLYSGYITSYDTNFQLGLESISSVTLQCVDAFRLFSNVAISTVAGTSAGQTTGARMNNLLDVPNFPTSMREIDTGDSTVQADPGTERDLLSALQTIENSEFGGFYIDPEGNAIFLSRDTLAQKADGTATNFADDGTGISYQAIDFAYDDTLIFNDVTVNREGGTAQTVQDTSSIETYFIHSGKREGLLVQTDAESLNQATMILQSRKDAIFRIDSIGLNLADDTETARIVAGLSLDIFDLTNITKATPGSGSVTLELFVQGIQQDITTNTWTTKFFTAEPIIQAFILDSTTQGILGGANSVLSY